MELHNMDKVQEQINNLQKQIDALRQANTIPYEIDRAFQARGFSKVSIITGRGTLNVTGEYRLIIPGAKATSTAHATYDDASDGGDVGISVIPSVTYPGQYEIYVFGLATKTFNYVVFTNAPFTDES
jgi:hypothetical protein